jgi:hypothetical protein
MGAVILWTIVRMAVVIPLLWFLQGVLDYEFWLILGFFSIFGIVIYPAITQYKSFEEDNKEIITQTLCSSCRHFDKTAVLCMKYDQHPTKQTLPCEGNFWEPAINEQYEEKQI